MMWSNAGHFIDNNNLTVTRPWVAPPDQVQLMRPDTPDTLTITRRKREFGCLEVQIHPLRAPVPLQVPPSPPRLIEPLQKLWKEHIQAIVASSEKEMWRVFCSVRKQPRVVQSAVLRAVRSVLPPSRLAAWPMDRRQVDNLISRVGGFNTRVTRNVKIDMRDYNVGEIQFRFVDPLYAWTRAAYKTSLVSPMHFEYIPRYTSARQRLYGTSVATGEIMRMACARVRDRLVVHCTLFADT